MQSSIIDLNPEVRFTRATASTALADFKTSNNPTCCVQLRNIIRQVIIPLARPMPGYAKEYEKIAQSVDVVNPFADWNFPDRPENSTLLLCDRLDELSMKVDRLIARRRELELQLLERRAA